MEEIVFTIRIGLAALFAVAGIGKLLDLKESVRTVREFGINGIWADAAGYGLPAAELVFAVFLLFPSTSWYGAVGVAALLAVFIAAMAWQMSNGRAPDCNCFGQLYSEPISVKTVVRNALLLAFALIVVFQGQKLQGPALASTRDGLIQTIFLLALIVAAVIGISYLKKLLSVQNEIGRKVELLELLSTADTPKKRQDAGDPNDGLPIGAMFPDFRLPDRKKALVTRQILTERRRPILFLFVGPNCAPCQALMPEIVGWNSELAGKLEIVLITSGTVKENAAKFGADNTITVLFDDDREFAKSVNAKWTPSGILVRPDGRVASRLAAGDAAIRELKAKAAGVDAADKNMFVLNGSGIVEPKIGRAVPDFSLRTLKGQTFTGANLKGRPTLAVFWSPTCPHCTAMIPALKEWDLKKDAEDPNLVVFSEGDEAAHRDLNLKSPVVLDDDYRTANVLGMLGTPSAVLISEDGIVASELAIGARNIWSLVDKQ